MSPADRRQQLVSRIQQLLDERKKDIREILKCHQRPRLRIVDRAFAEYR